MHLGKCAALLVLGKNEVTLLCHDGKLLRHPSIWNLSFKLELIFHKVVPYCFDNVWLIKNKDNFLPLCISQDL